MAVLSNVLAANCVGVTYLEILSAIFNFEANEVVTLALFAFNDN